MGESKTTNVQHGEPVQAKQELIDFYRIILYNISSSLAY